MNFHPIKHFKVITKHRHKVMYHCSLSGIGFQGLFHDLSKYSPTEFWAGAMHFQGIRSPNEHEREVSGYSSAWLHHKGRNKHHFEYWMDYNPQTKVLSPVKMPLKYLIEMFCDRVAASKIYMGVNYNNSSVLEYFLKAKKTRIIHQETSDFLEFLLNMLSKNGEKETFTYIKKYVKNNQNY